MYLFICAFRDYLPVYVCVCAVRAVMSLFSQPPLFVPPSTEPGIYLNEA